jgi:hypothetical protein
MITIDALFVSSPDMFVPKNKKELRSIFPKVRQQDLLPSQNHTKKSTISPGSAGWYDTCCDKNIMESAIKGVNCACACLGESAATKQQTAAVAGQVKGVADVINNLHVQAESLPARTPRHLSCLQWFLFSYGGL